MSACPHPLDTAALTASLSNELAAAGVARLELTPEASAAYGIEYEVTGWDAAGRQVLSLLPFMDYCDAARLPGTLRYHLANLADKRRATMLESARRALAAKVPRIALRPMGKIPGLMDAVRAYTVTSTFNAAA